MKAQVLYEAGTGRVVSAGFAVLRVNIGQAVLEISGDIPFDITRTHLVEAGKLRPKTAEELAADVAAEADRRKDFTLSADPLVRALGLVMLDEINALRQKAGLAERTPAQLVAAVKAKIGALSRGDEEGRGPDPNA